MGIIASVLWFRKKKKGNATTNGSDPAATTTTTPARPGPLAGWKKGTFEGVTYSYLYIKPASEDKATFLLLHGFPNGTRIFELYTRVYLTTTSYKTHVASSVALASVADI